MANAVENKKPSFGKRFVGFFARIGRFFKNMFSELKKVTWPSKKAVVNYSLVVFAFMVVMGVIIGAIDFGSEKIVDLIVRR